MPRELIGCARRHAQHCSRLDADGHGWHRIEAIASRPSPKHGLNYVNSTHPCSEYIGASCALHPSSHIHLHDASHAQCIIGRSSRPTVIVGTCSANDCPPRSSPKDCPRGVAHMTSSASASRALTFYPGRFCTRTGDTTVLRYLLLYFSRSPILSLVLEPRPQIVPPAACEDSKPEYLKQSEVSRAWR